MLVRSTFYRTGLMATLCLLLASCDTSDHEQAPTAIITQDQTATIETTALATQRVWEALQQQTQVCRQEAQALQLNIQQLLDQADTNALTATQTQWQTTHTCVMQLAPLFALAKVSALLFQPLAEVDYQLDAQPLQPGYLDYVELYPQTGLVNDISINLSAQTLRQQHGLTDAEDVVLGLHAIAFLLWGENLQRPLSDLAEKTLPVPKTDIAENELPANRRRTMLQLQGQLLVDDLHNLHRSLGINQPLTITYLALPGISRNRLWQQVTRQQLVELLRAIQSTLDNQDSLESPLQHSVNEALEGVRGLNLLVFDAAAPLASEPWVSEVSPPMLALTNNPTLSDSASEYRRLIDSCNQALRRLKSATEPTPISLKQ